MSVHVTAPTPTKMGAALAALRQDPFAQLDEAVLDESCHERLRNGAGFNHKPSGRRTPTQQPLFETEKSSLVLHRLDRDGTAEWGLTHGSNRFSFEHELPAAADAATFLESVRAGLDSTLSMSALSGLVMLSVSPRKDFFKIRTDETEFTIQSSDLGAALAAQIHDLTTALR